ncbi:MAG: SDR family NAD(P)-dependent oxidoreductase [Ruminococcus sp.]|jgi:short-subunit dehydrogenase
MRIALITGASSGLGRQFVLEISKREGEIEEIWAVARRQERLQELQKECSVPVRTCPLDLTSEEELMKLERQLEKRRPEIRLLINGAGFGKIGSYQEVSLKDSLDMIDLNCRAAVAVTVMSLPFMKKGGRILQICSTAAFQPFPYLNIYSASKAFLYRYSRGLRREVMGREIYVTAVCPYWIKDTEFIPGAKESQGKNRIRHFLLASPVRSVAKWALLDSRLGLAVSTPGPVCMVHRLAAKFLPSFLMMDVWELLRRI